LSGAPGGEEGWSSSWFELTVHEFMCLEREKAEKRKKGNVSSLVPEGKYWQSCEQFYIL
jgi:hypothetical protein